MLDHYRNCRVCHSTLVAVLLMVGPVLVVATLLLAL